MYYADYDDAQIGQAEYEWLQYRAWAYPALAYAAEARFPRRDFLRNPHALPF